VELTGDVRAFSELVGSPVYDQGGRRIGRVFEARAHWESDGTIVLDELLVGRRALLDRLRGPGPDTHGIPWQAVSELGEKRIVVRDLRASR
jgi:sporulation protein YlmC with PRC-barrel domain